MMEAAPSAAAVLVASDVRDRFPHGVGAPRLLRVDDRGEHARPICRDDHGAGERHYCGVGDMWLETRARMASQDNPAFSRWQAGVGVCA
jgi:hypothetical protein